MGKVEVWRARSASCRIRDPRVSEERVALGSSAMNSPAIKVVRHGGVKRKASI
jgi:hypothetical protein